ncbi:DNA-3-methyladenine glycosylase [Lachnospiraceae bacterium]|nr:DNA-3-methyladenine glycosylase [Lachnospiraceae bacterium]
MAKMPMILENNRLYKKGRNMVTIQNKNFSVLQICMSGQCFRMEECSENKYCLVAKGRYLELSQHNDIISFDCTKEEYENIWEEYFDMNTDYGKIIADIDANDTYLMAAAEYGKGIRILQQDLWEMIISFIISQQNNIKRIRKCIKQLCEKYGEKRKAANNVIYFDFPTPESLAKTQVEALYDCGLGYRSRYIYETANKVYHGDINLQELWQMDYESAKKELLKLYGVGVKVADCICLFALHKTDAFPKDTHINKVLATQYPEGFPFEKYGKNSGILQQYLFYYDLKKR